MDTNNQQAIIQTLIERGNELLQRPFETVQFTKNAEADLLMNDLANHPHAFVLSCVMDRQIIQKLNLGKRSRIRTIIGQNYEGDDLTLIRYDKKE